MRNLFLAGFLVVTIGVITGSAIADDLFKYNYVELGYGYTTTEVQGSAQKEDDSDSSLPGVQASYAIHDLVAIQASYSPIKATFNGVINGIPVAYKTSGNYLSFGVDLHKSISDTTEIGLDLGHNLEGSSGTMSVAGFPTTIPSSTDVTNSFAIRARIALDQKFRIQASAGRTTGGSEAASTDYTASVEYMSGKKFSIIVEDDLSTIPTGNWRSYIVEARYYY